MNELLDKEFELEDGKKYIVVDYTSINKKNYALISNIDDILDSSFVQIILDDGISFETVTDQNLKREIMEKIKNNEK